MTGATTDDAKPHRVLVAEDEALIRLDLAEMLREEGYEVVGEAGDGQEAVELAEKLKPDLVIMDVKMPRRDGIDAASEIASKRIAPIVVLTAFSQRELVERAKGLLQAKQGMTEPEAFKWIQRAAMDRRTTMKRVAEVVLETLDAADDAAPLG